MAFGSRWAFSEQLASVDWILLNRSPAEVFAENSTDPGTIAEMILQGLISLALI
jgi:hypothetical protein